MGLRPGGHAHCQTRERPGVLAAPWLDKIGGPSCPASAAGGTKVQQGEKDLDGGPPERRRGRRMELAGIRCWRPFTCLTGLATARRTRSLTRQIPCRSQRATPQGLRAAGPAWKSLERSHSSKQPAERYPSLPKRFTHVRHTVSFIVSHAGSAIVMMNVRKLVEGLQLQARQMVEPGQ